MDIVRRLVMIAGAGLIVAASGCGGGPVRIGAVLPLTGPDQPYAEEVRRGIEIALGKDPAVGNRQIELVTADSAGRASQAAEALRALVEEKGIYAAIGGVREAELKGMVPVAAEEETILISPTATGNDVVGGSEWAFALWPPKALESTKLATAARQARVKYMALAWAQGPFGQGFKNEFVKAFKGQRGEVVGIQNFAQGLEGEAASRLAERLVAARPGAVFVVSPHYRDVVTLLPALKEAGFDGTVMATSSFAHPAALEAAGAWAEGLVFAAPGFDPAGSEEARAFSSAYREAYGTEPTVWAAYGHDAMKVLVAALESESTYAADTLGELRRTSKYPGAAGRISFDTKGKVVRALAVYTVRDGRAVPFAPVQAEE